MEWFHVAFKFFFFSFCLLDTKKSKTGRRQWLKAGGGLGYCSLDSPVWSVREFRIKRHQCEVPGSQVFWKLAGMGGHLLGCPPSSGVPVNLCLQIEVDNLYLSLCEV